MKHTDYIGAVERLRAALAPRREEYRATERAWLPLGEAQGRWTTRVDAVSMGADLDVGPCTAPGLSPRDVVHAQFAGRLIRTTRVGVRFDAEQWVSEAFARLFRDELVSAGHRQLAELYGASATSPGLPPADRVRELARIQHEIDDLERQEEAAIVTAAKAGIDIPRRPDCNPAIVLAGDPGSPSVIEAWLEHHERDLTLRAVMMSKAERHLEARRDLDRARTARERAQDSALRNHRHVGPTFDADVAAAAILEQRLAAEHTRAEEQWQRQHAFVDTLHRYLKGHGVIDDHGQPRPKAQPLHDPSTATIRRA